MKPSKAIAFYECPNCGAFDWARNSWSADENDEIVSEGFVCLECGAQLSLSFKTDPQKSALRLEAIRRDDAEIREMDDGYREVVVNRPSSIVDEDNEDNSAK